MSTIVTQAQQEIMAQEFSRWLALQTAQMVYGRSDHNVADTALSLKKPYHQTAATLVQSGDLSPKDIRAVGVVDVSRPNPLAAALARPDNPVDVWTESVKTLRLGLKEPSTRARVVPLLQSLQADRISPDTLTPDTAVRSLRQAPRLGPVLETMAMEWSRNPGHAHATSAVQATLLSASVVNIQMEQERVLDRRATKSAER